ncbi:hypothetical protein CAEBREN_28621 [Caenorhabditis brenneri]|uniref:RNA-directed DNA polymerase n=1 Tax=Caenorhabditis brenneri TaxID=135651 RepID=G0NBL0_CAEBE|nr:hypothetical protein CAEBREN_28621 [Caenorhabditis brenneri]
MLQLRNRPVLRPPQARLPGRPAGRGAGLAAGGAEPAPQRGGAAVRAANAPLTFKDLKNATDALLSSLPKFSGEKDEDTFALWLQKYVIESNYLHLGRQLTAGVFPRMLTGSARMKYDGLTNEEKADFTLASQALAARLHSHGGRNRAMTEMSTAAKKSTESMIKFARRVENLVRASFPTGTNEQRAELTINRFIEGLPTRIRTKVKVDEIPETLEEAIERAEKMENLIQEEDQETINLIDNVTRSNRNEVEEVLRNKVKQLTLENKQKQRLLDQRSQGNYQTSSNPRGRNSNRGYGFQPQDQRVRFSDQQKRENFQHSRSASNFGRNYSNQGNFRPNGGWQTNRAPIQSGIHFLMIVACALLCLPLAEAQFQICPDVRSGEYFSPPPQMTCELNPSETVVKVTVDIYTEFGASIKAKAHRCAQTQYQVCNGGRYQYLTGNPNIVNITSKPMTEGDCLSAIDQHQVKNQTLISKGNGIFHSKPHMVNENILSDGTQCSEGVVYALEVGEIATPDGERVISSLGDMAGCVASNGDCETHDARMMWSSEGITKFCKYSKVETTEAYITKTKIAIPTLQMALEIVSNQNETQMENCALRMAVIANNGFMISIKNHKQSISELIESVENKKTRVKRDLQMKHRPTDLLIQRLYGPNATLSNYPLFTYDPITDPRILHEIRRYDIALSHVRYQWENYELPNKQLAVLRAIREGEYRKQLIRELREGDGNLKNAVTIKQLEQPSHHFDEYLNEEFGVVRTLTPREKREWNAFGQPLTTHIPQNREASGIEYIKQMSEMHRIATENRANSQLNGRMQFVADKIIEASYQEFNKIYHKLCEMQNSQIEISKTLLAIDPTLGMRALLKRDDVVAKRAGMVYLVSQCSPVMADEVYYDHKVNTTCYLNTPVRVQNQTWFIAPGMEKDLIRESVEIPCDEVTLGIYKDKDGNWKSVNGPSIVRNIPITFMKKVEKLNLTLSAPPVFNKLENIDNPLAYLATWTVSLLKMKENQIELMRNLRNEGLSSATIEDILAGAGEVLGIVEEIHKTVKEQAGEIKTEIILFIKRVIIPIILVAAIMAAIIVIMKIYLLKRTAGKALSEVVNVTRRAPVAIQQMIRKWIPEVHNIMLKEDGETEFDVFSIERSDSLVTIPEVYTILTYSGMYTVPRLEIKINHGNVIALVDTGSAISLITDMMVKGIGSERRIKKSSLEYAKAANGDIMYFQGMVTERITVGNHHVVMDFFIVEEKEAPEQCVLGMDFIHQLNRQKLNVSFNIKGNHLTIGKTEVKILSQKDCQRIVHNQPTVELDEEDFSWSRKKLEELQVMCPIIIEIRKILQCGMAPLSMRRKYCLINDVVHRVPTTRAQKPLIFLESNNHIKHYIKEIHANQSHLGFEETLHEITKEVVWKGIRRDVRAVIANCMECKTKQWQKRMRCINSIMTVGGRTHLPFAPIHIDGVPIVALLDSGASISLIPERVVTKLNLKSKVKPTNSSAKVANGTELKFLGKVDVIITIGKTSVLHEVMITKNEGAPAACLLGIDFVNTLNKKGKLLTFNMAEKLVKVGDKTVHLLDPQEYGHSKLLAMSVACANDEIIPPRCQAIIAGELPGVITEDKDFIISDTDRDTEEIYSVSSTLTRMDSEGKVVIKITNPGNSELVLKKGTKIAEAEIWKEKEKSKNAVYTVCTDTNTLLSKIDLEKSTLSDKAKEKIKFLIKKYKGAFVGNDGKIGRFTGKTTHYIELNDNHRIPQSRPYRLNPEQREKLEKEIGHMLENGLIEESTSPYTSPLLMVPKANGDTRIVIDYRRLNLITRSRTYIMPNTLDVTEEASRGKIFSVFDIAQGFHTVRMHEAHKERTAFCCHMGVYQYRYMPMGLKGAPDTFQRAMAEVEKKFSGTMILYVDDLIVVSKTEDQHIRDLEEFFKLMISMGLKLKAEKSQIGRTRIVFLGFIIENNTIQPNGEKTEAIRKFPTPRTVTEVKSFLGMAGYFRRFIKNYAITVKPLTTLTQKDVEFKWTEEEEKAFEEIKTALISPPILTTPRMDGDFEMHTDASKVGLAAVLLQEQEKELKVVAYASRPTTPVEQRYVAIESEALAITWGLQHFRPYIFGKKVKVVTDHQPLKSLLHRKDKEMSGRLLRHQAIIQMYDVEIVYRPGKLNPLADALSRQRTNSEEQVTAINLVIEQTRDLKKIQKESKMVQYIRKKLSEDDEDDIETQKLQKKFMLIDDIVYTIPKKEEQLPAIFIEGGTQETRNLIMNIHKANSHIGPYKTISKLENIAIWNKMKIEVEEVLRTCEGCQRRKNPSAYTHVVPLGKWDIPQRPFQRIHVDVMGPLPETHQGNRLIIVATDAFSKFAIAKAIPNQTAETTIKFLIENVVAIHGVPEEIVSDKGRNFTSEIFGEVCKILEMKHSMSTSYHHETNGAVERLNRTLEEMLTLSTEDPKNHYNWDEKLPIVIHSYNAAYHSTVKFPPEYIVFGRVTVSAADIMVNTLRPYYSDSTSMVESLTEAIRMCHETVSQALEDAQNETKRTHDERRKVSEPIFRIGDTVVIKDHTAGKLMHQFGKPVTITATSASTVTVRTERGKLETVHKNRVKQFRKPQDVDQQQRVSHQVTTRSRSLNKETSESPLDSPSRHHTRLCNNNTNGRRHTFHGEKDPTSAQQDNAVSSPGLRRSRRLMHLPAEGPF